MITDLLFALLILYRNGTASVVTSNFGGILQNEVNCLICGTESRKFDPFLGKCPNELKASDMHFLKYTFFLNVLTTPKRCILGLSKLLKNGIRFKKTHVFEYLVAH